jgi:hypothetical protein
MDSCLELARRCPGCGFDIRIALRVTSLSDMDGWDYDWKNKKQTNVLKKEVGCRQEKGAASRAKGCFAVSSSPACPRGSRAFSNLSCSGNSPTRSSSVACRGGDLYDSAYRIRDANAYRSTRGRRSSTSRAIQSGASDRGAGSRSSRRSSYEDFVFHASFAQTQSPNARTHGVSSSKTVRSSIDFQRDRGFERTGWELS